MGRKAEFKRRKRGSERDAAQSNDAIKKPTFSKVTLRSPLPPRWTDTWRVVSDLQARYLHRPLQGLLDVHTLAHDGLVQFALKRQEVHVGLGLRDQLADLGEWGRLQLKPACPCDVPHKAIRSHVHERMDVQVGPRAIFK